MVTEQKDMFNLDPKFAKANPKRKGTSCVYYTCEDATLFWKPN